MKKRSFEVTLGYFVATVTITEDPPDPRRYHCSTSFNTEDPGPPIEQPLRSADEVLDILEVASLSNELMRELFQKRSPSHAKLRLVKPRPPGGRDD